MVEVRFDLTTFEGGRMVVRTARVEIEEGAALDRLEVRAAGGVVLSLPFSIDVAEEDEDEAELVSFNEVFHRLTGDQAADEQLRERAAAFDLQAIAGMRERARREGRTGL